MSSRLSCWLNGHNWRRPSRHILEDIWGNEWRIQTCRQCSARRRTLNRAWSDL